MLLGLKQPDDAAVYRLDDERALVVTTDFFTPIVDDAYAYGAIAAANALSDVYATGGRPLLALNILALPADLPPEVTTEILMGLGEKVRESGAVVAGGHTIQDKEPKVGLAVVGLAHPQRLLTKSAARPDDILVLTKPLGTGCITTAAKRDQAAPEHVAEAIGWMSRLNRAASEAALSAGVRAGTDVTGFGLLGHAGELASSSNGTLHIEFSRLPLMSGAAEYAERLLFPGGSKKNQTAFGSLVHFCEEFTPAEQLIVFDAQTSGGLLLAIPPAGLERFAREMERFEEPWWQIGKVGERDRWNAVVQR